MALVAAYVGNIPLFSLRGVPNLAQMDMTLKTRPGLNSFDIVLTGSRGKPFTMMMIHDFVSAAAMQTGIDSLSNKVSDTLTITDDADNDWPNMLFMKFEPKRFFKAAKCVGGYNAATGQERWILEADLTFVHLG